MHIIQGFIYRIRDNCMSYIYIYIRQGSFILKIGSIYMKHILTIKKVIIYTSSAPQSHAFLGPNKNQKDLNRGEKKKTWIDNWPAIINTVNGAPQINARSGPTKKSWPKKKVTRRPAIVNTVISTPI